MMLATIIDISIIVIFFAAVLVPFYFFKKFKNLFVAYFLSLIAMSALTILFYLWRSVSIDLELLLLDYDRWAFDAEVRTRNVPEGYKEYAEELLHAPIKNIGWPVRAGFGVMFLVFPYVTMIYALLALWKTIKMLKRKF